MGNTAMLLRSRVDSLYCSARYGWIKLLNETKPTPERSGSDLMPPDDPFGLFYLSPRILAGNISPAAGILPTTSRHAEHAPPALASIGYPLTAGNFR